MPLPVLPVTTTDLRAPSPRNCSFHRVLIVSFIVHRLVRPQKTPLNWMILNLALSDGAIAGFGYVALPRRLPIERPPPTNAVVSREQGARVDGGRPADRLALWRRVLRRVRHDHVDRR